MRHYRPLWEAIKNKGTVSIVPDTKRYKTLIRMVSKEKDRDFAYRDWCFVHKGGYPKLKITKAENENILTFSLVHKITADDI